jgi:2-keto-4-pentenoate hydratase/2-oxohepta-3-ene-1,7-dioic acid hydratase in catechol pathway
LAIGLNFADHAEESKMPIPTEPVLFTKAISCLNGPNDDVMLPQGSTKGDWEIELGFIIGRTARYVEEADALDHVAGYVLVNDVSERGFQLERGGTWDKGKGCDTFGPVGPWFVTSDEVGDPQNLDMWLDVNGRRMQTGNTRTMIFTIRQLVSYISKFITLHPGDLIITGTPPGVGLGQKPDPIYLRAGDTMRLGIAKLGEQKQNVIAWSASAESDA